MTPRREPRGGLGTFGEFAALFAEPEDPAVVAAVRRRRRRGWISFGVVLLVVGGAIGTYLPLTLQAPAQGATVSVSQPTVAPAAASALAAPDVGQSAVSVLTPGFTATAGTSGILAASGGNAAAPMASISKLITALVVLEAKPVTLADPGPVLTFSRADHDLYDKYYLKQATIAPMAIGSMMTEREALETMLVISASNYAEAVSRWAFGSQEAFISATQSWLTKNGLTETRMVEPTGLDIRNVSTPSDLVTLGKLALMNPVIAEIVAQPSVTVANIGTLVSSNKLLGVDGINGIKTGTLENYSNLLFSAVIDIGPGAPATVVGVVLGGRDHSAVDTAARALLSSIRAGFHFVPVVAVGASFGSFSTPWGDGAGIVSGGTASLLTWSDTPIVVTVVTRPVTSGAVGSKVGTATYTAGESTLAVPLVLSDSIDGPGVGWRLTHPMELLGR